MTYYADKKMSTAVLAVLIVMFITSLIAYPQLTFEGAAMGMEAWLKVVFPALLPFFVGAEIMISIGVVDFMSVLLSPIMEPLFGCPGSSSFVWAMSMASGYPTCAQLTTLLRQQEKINRIEAQRILAFSSTSGPLFMLGAVGIGMLNSPRAGSIIAISHYTSATIIGVIFKYYGGRSKQNKRHKYTDKSMLKRAIHSMYLTRKKDERSFAQILGDSIKSSFETLTMVGGFLIVFSALIHIILKPSPSNQSFVKGVIGGMIEMTTGCISISQSSAPFAEKIAAISFVIGWSGLSVHCQVASMISKTDISIITYIVTKLLHGILSSIIGWSIAKVLYVGDIQIFNPSSITNIISFNFIIQYSIKLFYLAILLVSATGIFVAIFKKRV